MSDEAEKAWNAIAARDINSPREAFMAGRVSRDAEVAELRERLACYSDQEDRIQYLAEQLAEREAVIAEVERLSNLDVKCPCCTGYSAILDTVTAFPSTSRRGRAGKPARTEPRLPRALPGRTDNEGELTWAT